MAWRRQYTATPASHLCTGELHLTESVLLSFFSVTIMTTPSPMFSALSALPNARGRIEGRDDRGKPIVNPGSKIDGARFYRYDPDTDTVTIRVDHLDIPAFWMEVPFTMAALNAWVEIEKREIVSSCNRPPPCRCSFALLSGCTLTNLTRKSLHQGT